MAETQIANFATGRPVEGVFAVLRSQRRLNRNGEPYLVLELSDQTGTIEARVWDNADHFANVIKAGDRVRAMGKPSEFRGQLQFDVRRLEREDAADGDAPLLPQARRNADEIAGELDFLCDEIVHPFFRALVEGVWQGEHREALLRSPATVGDHHTYLAGLVEHTVAVTSIALAVADRHERINRDLLAAACLLHDVGRALEIQIGDAFVADEQHGAEAHVFLAHELLLETANRVGGKKWRTEYESEWAALVHAIAVHHGSGERARTAEASVLQTANALDARVSRMPSGLRK